MTKEPNSSVTHRHTAAHTLLSTIPGSYTHGPIYLSIYTFYLYLLDMHLPFAIGLRLGLLIAFSYNSRIVGSSSRRRRGRSVGSSGSSRRRGMTGAEVIMEEAPFLGYTHLSVGKEVLTGDCPSYRHTKKKKKIDR